DDFDLACSATPGSIHAHLIFQFGGFDTNAAIERGFFNNNRPDWTAFTRIHWWVKVASPASSIGFFLPYVVDNSNNGSYNPFIDAGRETAEAPNWGPLTDGNWHELVPTIRNTRGPPINPADILKFGIQVRAPLAPADAGPGPDGAAPVPAPV